MKNSSDQFDWPNQVYYRWVWLPPLAFILSLTAGLAMIVLFPILLTVAHYLTLRACKAVLRPGLWFITLPVTYLVWIWSITAYLRHSAHTNELVYLVAACYGGQLLNALIIPFMTENQPSTTAFTSYPNGTDLTIRWMLATALAAGIWIALRYISVALIDGILAGEPLAVREFWQGLSYYLINSLIANAISGLVLKGLERDA